ncbi:MAG: hypothetical protein JST00_37205 [Deltaproteobacteria bacterium]|nr:hypothetical protein [Deltaproteobacteria bacterium]
MKTSLLRLLPLMFLATSAVACASESEEPAVAGDEDDITSLTARARKLTFAGYVYVEEGTSDAMIVSEVKRQTQSAFGALREANIGVNSRELKDVDPSTFLKTPVSVVDTANPGAAPKKMTKVTYTFTDDAVVPVPMARRTAITLGLLGRNYQGQSGRVVEECTSGDQHAREFQGSVWYVFNPTLSNCKSAMKAEREKIDADRRGLAAGQVPKSEVDRLYIPMTARLKATTTQLTGKFPEYDRLYSGGVEPGKLVIGMVSGMMADWAAGERHEVYEDQGYEMWYGGLREIFKARAGFRLTGVEGVQDPLSYKVGTSTVRFGSFDEMIAFELDNRNPAGVTYANRNELRKVIANTLVRHFVTFEAPATVKIGADEKPLTIKLQTYFGAETDSTPHKRAIKTSDIFVYNGHSYIGYGPLDPSRFQPSDFPNSYQVLMINGCVSYNYYEKDYVPLKPGGTQNLDLVTNGLESWVNESGEAMGRFVGSFIDGKINNYEAILKNSQFTYYGYDWGMDALRVVDGEADNKFTPTRTPITLR